MGSSKQTIGAFLHVRKSRVQNLPKVESWTGISIDPKFSTEPSRPLSSNNKRVLVFACFYVKLKVQRHWLRLPSTPRKLLQKHNQPSQSQPQRWIVHWLTQHQLSQVRSLSTTLNPPCLSLVGRQRLLSWTTHSQPWILGRVKPVRSELNFLSLSGYVFAEKAINIQVTTGDCTASCSYSIENKLCWTLLCINVTAWFW